MPDLKTFWPNPGGPDQYPGLGGDNIVSSGSDPQVTVDSPNALDPLWANPSVPTPGGEETENSVSGLPSLPNRFAPTDQPPPIPSLQDRRPTTIDER